MSLWILDELIAQTMAADPVPEFFVEFYKTQTGYMNLKWPRDNTSDFGGEMAA